MGVLEEIILKYICYLINQIMVIVIFMKGGSILVKGSNLEMFCGIVFNEVFGLLIICMEEWVVIEDFS